MTNELVQLWFTAAPWSKTVVNISEVINICSDKSLKDFLDNQNVEFDGLVIKLAKVDYRKFLWNTSHHPKWAIAFKFESKQARTTLENIERQVGRTGILTPVANVKTVELSWVNISRVTLHNWDFLMSKDIYIWDQIIIQRSWEVIPYVVATIAEYRDGSQIKPQKPAHCPVCGESVDEEFSSTGNISFYCVNTNCPASLKERIRHFVSRDCMNVEWLGDAIIDMMVDNGVLWSVDDLYKFTDPNMRLIVKSLPWMWDKKIDNIVAQLENSKNAELRRIINALWIRQVGKKTAKMIADHIEEEGLKS